MTIHGYAISALYFGFGPVAGHCAGCPRQGTDMWEVTRHRRKNFDGEVKETTLRVACFECGAVLFETFEGQSSSFESTHATETGYGSKPERVLGLWLWPGPRIWHRDERGPTAYYVTRTNARPRQPSDAVGMVGWGLGKRGGVRWSAGLEPTGHSTVKTASDQDWPSRRAAVAWIAAQLAEHQDGAR